MKRADWEPLRGCLGCLLAMGLFYGLFYGALYFSLKSGIDEAKRASQAKPTMTREVDPDEEDAHNEEQQQINELESQYEESYVDPDWPTTDFDLLAVPEENRWYTSYYHIGETHTVVGPVVRVYQAMDEYGQPVFIDIGNDYPSTMRFTVVIWAEDLDDELIGMLNDIDDGDAWLSVTGYISSYDDVPQMSSGDGPIQYTWYTNVR